jgi:hypothetical protein
MMVFSAQLAEGRGACPLGGFNVSNLMGIKRRMIDGKKITIYFFKNYLKCTVFWHVHLKFAKSAIMTQQKFFLKFQKSIN